MYSNTGLGAQHLIEVGVFKQCNQAIIILEDPDFKQRLIIQQSADSRGRPGFLPPLYLPLARIQDPFVLSLSSSMTVGIPQLY